MKTVRPKTEMQQIIEPYTQHLADVLHNGGVAVIPTDTIYGIVGRCDLPDTVRKIRRLKNRGYDQAFIVLCANVEQVRDFGIDKRILAQAAKHWPGKVSIVMDTTIEHPEVSGRLEGIAFRIPDHEALRSLLLATGPLVAPSANPKDNAPPIELEPAKTYFGARVDCYIDGGPADSKPSKLIKIKADGTQEIIRD